MVSRLCGPRHISDLHPSGNEEVDPTALHHSLHRHPVWHQHIAVQQAGVPVHPKDALPAALLFTPGDILADIFYVISRLLCVSPHTSRHQ